MTTRCSTPGCERHPSSGWAVCDDHLYRIMNSWATPTPSDKRELPRYGGETGKAATK